MSKSNAERDEAIEEGAKAIGVMSQYSVRLLVTARVHSGSHEFEASSDEAASKYVEALDCGDYSFEYSNDDGIEGDEIAFWRIEDEHGDYDDEVEVDLRKEGEPFSWTACEIVKDLAKLETADFDHEDIAKLVQRAVTACKKE